MSNDSAFLCIDAGSQSVRASLINANGQQLVVERIPLAPPESPQPGWAEYPVDALWKIVVRSIRATVESARKTQTDITAIGVTCQRATVINLDRNGQPLRPAMLWSDRRRVKGVKPVGGFTGLGMSLIGVSNTVRHLQAEAEINWLQAHQPEVWDQTDKFLFLSGYLNYRLSGEYKDSIASQVGYVPFSFRHHAWAKPHSWHWRALPGIRQKQLPELVTPGTTLGHLDEAIATELQLPSALPIIACATDKACEVLGSGCVKPTQACLSFGTAATVNVPLDRYKEVERFIPPYPAAIPGRFLTEIQIYRGFWLVSWFKNEFAQMESQIAATQDVATESLLDDLLRETPPGALGLTAQPYWAPGVRIPGPEARGALLGFNDKHTRAHVYRALLEGLAYSLKEGLERIEAKTGTRVSLLKVAGGGSQSDEILQLTANIFNLPVERNQSYEASSTGAAICCAVALGAHSSFESATNAMTASGQRFAPQPAMVKIYKDIYEKVYLKMYRRLRPLYKNLLTITEANSD